MKKPCSFPQWCCYWTELLWSVSGDTFDSLFVCSFLHINGHMTHSFVTTWTLLQLTCNAKPEFNINFSFPKAFPKLTFYISLCNMRLNASWMVSFVFVKCQVQQRLLSGSAVLLLGGCVLKNRFWFCPNLSAIRFIGHCCLMFKNTVLSAAVKPVALQLCSKCHLLFVRLNFTHHLR